ncbi:MAG: polysaccharide biosynthesis protein [Alphaproteobacteria bacterium]|nr:MAG: polysaccharide biosynthesis protein [Alphaproteobacteria bacterium]
MFKNMKFSGVAITIVMCLSVLGCALKSTEMETRLVQNIEYRLGTGDTIRLIVFGHEKLSGEFNVGPSGKVSFPLILNTQTSGLTTKELETLITEELTPQYLLDPKVSVEVLSYRDVYILGEVRTPGKYPFIPNMTVKQAVAIAGGYTYRAREDIAELTHQSEDTITTKIVDTISTISPGDTLVITRKWF